MKGKRALELVFLGGACLSLSVVAHADGDVGTITPETLESSFPKQRPYSPTSAGG